MNEIRTFEEYANKYNFDLTKKRLKLICMHGGYFPCYPKFNLSLTGKTSGMFTQNETYIASIMINSKGIERVIIKGTSISSGLWFHNMFNSKEINNTQIFKIIEQYVKN